MVLKPQRVRVVDFAQDDVSVLEIYVDVFGVTVGVLDRD